MSRLLRNVDITFFYETSIKTIGHWKFSTLWRISKMKSLNLDNMSNHNSPYYSDKYTDDKFEYRHVHIPREWVKAMPKDRTMTEQEWRELGKKRFILCVRSYLLPDT